MFDFCGPTILDCSAPGFLGARRHTNNVGEVAALLLALRWVKANSVRKATILYDSEYAAGVINRRFRAKSNLSLVLAARLAYDQVAQAIALVHVDAHTGHHMNERADTLTNCGSAGILCGNINGLFSDIAFEEDAHS